MSSRRRSQSSRRKKRRSGSSPMPMGGAGLMRFFEDSSIGVKVGPISTVILSAMLILVVILAHLGIFNWIFTPASAAAG
ncbi:MAG: preprotein translocase subunit Sec61beta [Candidatus Lokiarchaeota archaeon]|nr:preprotein translocase subunit Sec61beta [Candidatus Lokiarchaeota archaeon]MBD3339273.1 preprotein translocase subunit Sec61beta [Candidatus Lokiarchaeota archaeon]